MIAAPTSIARRRGFFVGVDNGVDFGCGHTVAVAFGLEGDTCSGIGDTVGINLALGESSAAGARFVLALFCRIHPVRPKNSAMW